MKTVVLLGASADREKYGNKAVRAFLSKGYNVIPINPKESEIEGLKCYSSLDEIKETVDILSIYLPPNVTLTLIDKIKKLDPKEIYINPGADSEDLIKALEENNLKIKMTCSIRSIGQDPSDY